MCFTSMHVTLRLPMSNLIFLQIFIYCVCFGLVWVGAGLVVSPLASLARSWRLPSFVVSFFILGILTSLPELTIGTVSVLSDDPSIFVGNLLGGVIILLLGVVPLLGVLGNGVKLPVQLGKKELLLTLIVIMAPAFLTADQQLTPWEGVFLIVLYGVLLVFFFFEQSFFGKMKSALNRKQKNWVPMVLKIGVGMGLLVIGSHQIVQSTLYFADILKISPFFVSLIVVALGTNIPEISIIFRSVMSHKKNIALADYLGSASANTLLMGVFAIAYGQTIILSNHFFQRFFFIGLGVILFFLFARTRNTISRAESLLLLALYLGFLTYEVLSVVVLR